ncbi:MAG: alcohol dehydrogenase, partial [Planctomycetes bacterium]|nr:alcohol dehydrogenase [Planctomycetota bacterium]
MAYSSVVKLTVAWLVSDLCCLQIQAEDWPQFLGRKRNGNSSESSLIDAFPESGPSIRWRVPGGVGMSAIAVQGNNALTTWNAHGKQWLVALNTATGKEKWKTELGQAYKNSMGDGPRATPTISESSAYVYSGEGILTSVDSATGQIHWRKDVMEELSANPSDYGMSCSPLVVEDRVIVHAGGAEAAVVAFSITDGKRLWTSGNGHAGYSSPVLMDIAGTSQVISFTGTCVTGIDPKNGDNLWTYPFETDYGCNTACPVWLDNGVFISSGENHGSVLLDIKKENGVYSVSERWKSLDS